MFFVFCFLILSFSTPVWSGEILTIDAAVSEALSQNPKLKAKEALVEAAKAKIGIARSLDDPQVGVEFYDVPINTTDVTRGMETNYSFSQKIPFPSKLITRGNAAKQNYLAEKSSYDLEGLSVVVQTEHAFHELYFLEHSLAINKDLQNIFKKLVVSEEGRYTTGDETSQNFLKSKVELEKLQTEEALLEAKSVQARAMLNILRHKNPGEEIHLAELPQHNFPLPAYTEVEKKVLERHPELKEAEYAAAAAKEKLILARQQLVLPDLEARFTYAQRFGQVDAWTGEARINIPFLWGQNRKVVKEARAMEEMSKQELESVKDQRLAELQETYARFEGAKKSYDLYQNKILPHAALALKSAEAAYQTGKIDFLNFVDTAREFQSAKQGALEAFVEYHKAVTHLKWATGEK